MWPCDIMCDDTFIKISIKKFKIDKPFCSCTYVMFSVINQTKYYVFVDYSFPSVCICLICDTKEATEIIKKH